MLRFRDLGASCFGLRFRVPRFRNYLGFFGNNLRPGVFPHLLLRESSFNMTRGGGGDEDIETRSLKF